MSAKALNLYAGIGGNRKLWDGVDVTAVEINPKIAAFYQSEFPDDDVVVADAHEFLLGHYDAGWDFIWSSPPCQTHSQMSYLSWKSDVKQNAVRDPVYPDMRLYQEVLFLQHFAECDWVVENVDGYYEPLIRPQKAGRHYFWSNYHIPDFETPPMNMMDTGTEERLKEEYGYDLSDVDLGHRKDQVLRNCVHPELGRHVLDAALKNRQATFAEVDP